VISSIPMKTTRWPSLSTASSTYTLQGTIPFELTAAAILVLGAAGALLLYLVAIVRRQDPQSAYNRVRTQIARTILLGLEVLIIADVLFSVGIDPSLQSLGGLALLVVIRTFLSWSLEVEIDGRWPWQRSERPSPEASNDDGGG